MRLCGVQGASFLHVNRLHCPCCAKFNKRFQGSYRFVNHSITSGDFFRYKRAEDVFDQLTGTKLFVNTAAQPKKRRCAEFLYHRSRAVMPAVRTGVFKMNAPERKIVLIHYGNDAPNRNMEGFACLYSSFSRKIHIRCWQYHHNVCAFDRAACFVPIAFANGKKRLLC